MIRTALGAPFLSKFAILEKKFDLWIPTDFCNDFNDFYLTFHPVSSTIEKTMKYKN